MRTVRIDHKFCLPAFYRSLELKPHLSLVEGRNTFSEEFKKQFLNFNHMQM